MCPKAQKAVSHGFVPCDFFVYFVGFAPAVSVVFPIDSGSCSQYNYARGLRVPDVTIVFFPTFIPNFIADNAGGK
jgi:hypothetical protein